MDSAARPGLCISAPVDCTAGKQAGKSFYAFGLPYLPWFFNTFFQLGCRGVFSAVRPTTGLVSDISGPPYREGSGGRCGVGRATRRFLLDITLITTYLKTENKHAAKLGVLLRYLA